VDWRVFFIAFISVFLAELGDKTELMVLSLSSRSQKMWPVFWGAALALVTATFLAVVFGRVLQKYLPPSFLRYFAAFIFLVLALIFLFKKG